MSTVFQTATNIWYLWDGKYKLCDKITSLFTAEPISLARGFPRGFFVPWDAHEIIHIGLVGY